MEKAREFGIRRLTELEAELQELKSSLALIEEPEFLMTFPPGGGKFPEGKGETVFELRSGKVKHADGTSDQISPSLRLLRVKWARSFFLWVDQQVDVEILREGRKARFPHEQSAHTYLRHVEFDELHILSEFPLVFYIVIGVKPEQPVFSVPTASNQFRLAIEDTLDSFTAVVFRSAVGTKVVARTLGNSVLQVPNLRTKTFLVENTGSNSIDFNLQGREVDQESFNDDPATASSFFVPARTTRAFTTTRFYHFMQARIRSMISGASSSVRIQFGGSTP